MIAGAVLAAGAAAWLLFAPGARHQGAGVLGLVLDAGRVFGPLLIGLYLLLLVVRSYRRFFQMATLVITPLAAVAGVVCLLLPAVEKQTGYILLGVAAGALVLFGVSTWCVMFACPACGSFKIRRQTDSARLVGSGGTERRYRVCSACDHHWQDTLDRI